jgi:hypothetical protein
MTNGSGSTMKLLNRLIPKSPEERFWSWFKSNSDRLFSFEQNQEAIFRELDATLAEVDSELTFEFGPVRGGRREFFISAGGNKKAFPVVERLVAAAPELLGWRIVAFIPRRGVDLQLEIGDIQIGPDDVWFRLERDGAKVGVSLYLEEFDDPEGPASVQATFLMLDGALGEYDVEIKVGFIERHRLPPNPAQRGLRPFHELPDAFDQLFASLGN